MAIAFAAVEAALCVHRVAVGGVSELAVNLRLIGGGDLHNARVVDITEEQVAAFIPHGPFNKAKLPATRFTPEVGSGNRRRRFDFEGELPLPHFACFQLHGTDTGVEGVCTPNHGSGQKYPALGPP